MKNKYLHRVFRLRRLIFLSLFLLFVPWAVGTQVFGHSALLAGPKMQLVTALFGVFAIMLLVLIYPRVWWETVTTALVLGITLMLLPVIEMLPDLAPTQNQGKATAWTIIGTVLVSFFLWLGLNWLPSVFLHVPLGLREWKSRARYLIPAQRAFDILKTAPDSYSGKYKTGPVGDDGLFTVSMNMNTVNPDTWDPENMEMLYKCKIEQESGTSQVISTYYMVEGEANVDVELLTVRGEGQAAICETVTIRSRRNLYEDLGFWVQDFGADHLHARLDAAEDLSSIALVDLPYVSPLVGLARFFEQFNEDPPGKSGGSI
ncbi:hypothetical protein [Ruegeria lacuscaerulensis]|uniref:hypothetical protein n=1 Tax=Ruegeria lacuscaerulensis TaxID=55218 RepID=UPI00147B0688|nr:hypothetical protein [Ruegeria lacuscaerulensis]